MMPSHSHRARSAIFTRFDTDLVVDSFIHSPYNNDDDDGQ